MPFSGFWYPSGPESENQSKLKQKQVLRLCHMITDALKLEGDGNTNWSAKNGPQRLGKGTGKIGNLWMKWDHPLVRSAGMLSFTPKMTWYHSDSSKRPSAYSEVKNSQER